MLLFLSADVCGRVPVWLAMCLAASPQVSSGSWCACKCWLPPSAPFLRVSIELTRLSLLGGHLRKTATRSIFVGGNRGRFNDSAVMTTRQAARSTSMPGESAYSSVPLLHDAGGSTGASGRSRRDDPGEPLSPLLRGLDRRQDGVVAGTRGRFGHTVDGCLALWQELENEEEWCDLLLGNGLSSHIWPGFAYSSLYAQACLTGLLRNSERELFDAGATENFESVLGALAISIRTLDTLREPAAERLRSRYLRIQRALGAAVRQVHVPLSVLPSSTRRAVRSTLRQYRWVFTTSYDLMLYWCAGYGESFDGFADFFFCNDRLEFDPRKPLSGATQRAWRISTARFTCSLMGKVSRASVAVAAHHCSSNSANQIRPIR